MKYKIFDKQVSSYAFNEKGFDSFREAVSQLLSYFAVDHSREELFTIEQDLKNVGEYAEMIIEEVSEGKNISLTEKELTTLLNALNHLVEFQQDTVDHTKLFKKINYSLEVYHNER